MLLFRSEEHVKRWCKQWKHPRGAVLSLKQCWGLAQGFYRDRLSPHWRPKSVAETHSLFSTLGLTGPFWRLL